jgi:lipooligosaccharide transport system permease protein
VPLVFFSGIFFPLERLPGVLRAVALFSPLNQCVAMARDAAAGDLSRNLLLNGCAVIVLTGIVMPIPIQMLKKRLVG